MSPPFIFLHACVPSSTGEVGSITPAALLNMPEEQEERGMVRLGFIGCGTHATMNLYPCLRLADCRLLAVCDPVDGRREHCARVFGAPRQYAEHAELLEKEGLDAVMICGPAAMHHQVALDALRSGLHVFIEKPPAPTLAAAREIRDAARAAGRIYMCAFMKRFAQKYVLAAQLSAKPEFGGRQHLLLRYSHGAKIDPHGTLTLMTIHAIDLVRHFMGEITAAQICRNDVDGASSFTVQLRCERGPATLVSLATAPGVTERLELTGKGQSIVVDEVATLSHFVMGPSIWAPPVATLYRNNFPLQTMDNSSAELQGYAGEVRAFIDAVRTGTPPAVATIDDAVRAMQIIEAIENTTWGTVEIPDYDQAVLQLGFAGENADR
jgi:predicted dehydrogenase